MARASVISSQWAVGAKISDYKQLFKLRLLLTVVFSAAIGFLFAAPVSDLLGLLMICLGGFLVTAGANSINQIIEKDTDKLMKRTASRPLAADRMTTTEAILVAGITGVTGIFILSWYFNPLAGLIGAVSLLMYGFIYTPLKRVSNIAVFVGAIPGALPPVIGYVAITNRLDIVALTLFAIQFIWQFPHFWAVAWVAYDDYKNGGFHLLPSSEGRGKASAFQTMLYSAFMVPVSLVPFFMGFTGWISAVIVLLAGLSFLWLSLQLYLKCDNATAKWLMFASFIYLPIVFLALVMNMI